MQGGAEKVIPGTHLGNCRDILIAADIFGHTPALDRLAGQLPGSSIEIVDPYGGQKFFQDEAEAYDFFSSHLTIAAYGRLIADRLKSGNPAQILLGFSVGASAIWHLSGDPAFAYINKAFGFYGSQIRHHTQIQPVFDIRLIFPNAEPYFDVDALIQTLETISRVSCLRTAGLHGYMNEYSQNFDAALYQASLAHLVAQFA